MLLEVRDITKTFANQSIPVLSNISFSLEQGDRVGIVGASGSGKTTLVRIIAGLERADSGSITFNGATLDYGAETVGVQRHNRHRNYATKESYKAWLDMQMVFQNPRASFSHHMDIGTAVWEGAAYHPSFASTSKFEKKKLVVQALEAVGLPASFAKRRAFELSGGECQRAAIARAIIGDPKLIICDEATSALDVTVQANIMNLLERLYQEREIAFVFVSHNSALMQRFCDRVYSVGI